MSQSRENSWLEQSNREARITLAKELNLSETERKKIVM